MRQTPRSRHAPRSRERDPLLEQLNTPEARAWIEAQRAWIREQFGAPPGTPITLQTLDTGMVCDDEGNVLSRLGDDGEVAIRIAAGGPALLVVLPKTQVDDQDFDLWAHLRQEIAAEAPGLPRAQAS